jgi:hypothetical protein
VFKGTTQGYDEKVKTPSEKLQEDLEPLPG